MTGAAVNAAVLISRWWLLCVMAVPLYLALPITGARTDPAEVVRLLSPKPIDHHGR